MKDQVTACHGMSFEGNVKNRTFTFKNIVISENKN